MAPRKKKDMIDSDENIKTKNTDSYKHYVPASPTLENFEEVYQLKHHLIRTYDELMDF